MNINVKLKNLGNAHIPTRGTDYSAGLDLYTTESYELRPGEVHLFKTDFAIEPPEGYAGFVFPRSGTSVKQQLNLINCVAVIDCDYRGELMIPIQNNGSVMRKVNAGDRIAQILFFEVPVANIEVVDELSDTTRGDGGFGSTGKE